MSEGKNIKSWREAVNCHESWWIMMNSSQFPADVNRSVQWEKNIVIFHRFVRMVPVGWELKPSVAGWPSTFPPIAEGMLDSMKMRPLNPNGPNEPGTRTSSRERNCQCVTWGGPHKGDDSDCRNSTSTKPMWQILAWHHLKIAPDNLSTRCSHPSKYWLVNSNILYHTTTRRSIVV